MKKFAESLKSRLEHLDSEVVKLKGGFINAVDYEDSLMKLFELADAGDL